MKTYTMPDPGEGLTEAEVVSWLVSPGDTVKINDVLCEVETAKSIVELPSPFAGTVHSLAADEGQTVPVGGALIVIDDGSGADDSHPGDGADQAGTDDAGPELGSRRVWRAVPLGRPPLMSPRLQHPRARRTRMASRHLPPRPDRTGAPPPHYETLIPMARRPNPIRRIRHAWTRAPAQSTCWPSPRLVGWPPSWVWTSPPSRVPGGTASSPAPTSSRLRPIEG